jgi:hypothetical protein
VFTKQQGILVAVIALALAAFLFQLQANVAGWLSIVFACLMIYGYFRYRPVYLLTLEVSRGNFARAKTLLIEIGDPSRLSRQEQAYFYLATGWIDLENQAYEEAENKIKHSLSMGLRTSNDMALGNLLLARVYAAKGLKEIAQDHLCLAREFQHKEEVAVEIANLEATLDHDREMFNQPP